MRRARRRADGRSLTFGVLLALPVAGTASASAATSRPVMVPDRSCSPLECNRAAPRPSRRGNAPPIALPSANLLTSRSFRQAIDESLDWTLTEASAARLAARCLRTTTYTTPEGACTRDAILDAAISAFAARGYRGASIDSIAAEVGVSRQGVLHHFPSKVKLLVAVLQRRDEQDTAVAAEKMERQGSLVEAVDAWRQYRADRLGLAQLYTVLSAESVDPAAPGPRLLRRSLPQPPDQADRRHHRPPGRGPAGAIPQPGDPRQPVHRDHGRAAASAAT